MALPSLFRPESNTRQIEFLAVVRKAVANILLKSLQVRLIVFASAGARFDKFQAFLSGFNRLFELAGFRIRICQDNQQPGVFVLGGLACLGGQLACLGPVPQCSIGTRSQRRTTRPVLTGTTSPPVAAQIAVSAPEVSAKRIRLPVPRNPVLFGPRKPLQHLRRRLDGSPDVQGTTPAP
jgi:hypothetical protein